MNELIESFSKSLQVRLVKKFPDWVVTVSSEKTSTETFGFIPINKAIKIIKYGDLIYAMRGATAQLEFALFEEHLCITVNENNEHYFNYGYIDYEIANPDAIDITFDSIKTLIDKVSLGPL